MAVQVVTSELVAPSEATPRRALWLSNLDLGARNGYSPTVYFFRAPHRGDGKAESFFSAGVLRAALARALVPFHPFAGRPGGGRGGGAEINCNDQGALFVVARSEAALDDFQGFAPSKEMRDMFVPPYDNAGAGAPLLMLQVTFFRCGGVALGTAMHHFVIDGRSAFHFIQTWSGDAVARRRRSGWGEPAFLAPALMFYPGVRVPDELPGQGRRRGGGRLAGAGSHGEVQGALLRGDGRHGVRLTVAMIVLRPRDTCNVERARESI
uniref:Anthranilate N-benzoyltransferase protein 1 n=1 Tax=Aegilops tauschii TaxID=37682 RepID=N1QT13_AEGTA